MIQAYFPPLHAHTKFNLVTSMCVFFVELLKDEPSIIVVNPASKLQIVLATNPLLTNEEKFKKFFTVMMDTHATTKKQHIIIRCTLLSKFTLNKIKFDTKQKTFMDWLAKEKIFVKLDSLGVTKTTTIGYLAKLLLHITNQKNLKQLLNLALEDVNLNPTLAVELDPSLQTYQTEAMMNRDVYNPDPPPFELYTTRISHGHNKE